MMGMMRGRKEPVLWMGKLRPEEGRSLLKDYQIEGVELEATLRFHKNDCDDTWSWVR